jgi:glycosyltransferase involved in cell wall biosynthesis
VTAVVFATRRPPFPLENGARIRSQRLAAGLARHLDVHLITFADAPTYDDTAATRADLERVLPGVDVELVPYGRRHPGGARRGILGRASTTWGHYATPTLRSAYQRALARRPGAILHVDDPGVGLAALGLPGAAATVFAPHNVEHRIVQEIARERPWDHRPFLEAEWRKVRAEERRLWRRCDLTLAVSEIDAATFRAGGARAVELAPNGADDVRLGPWAPPAGGEPLRLLFVGSVDYWPYEFGVAWFVREALPLLRADGPVVFDVVGAPPPHPVHAEGVSYHGRVRDVLPYYERAHALVIPVFQGSGTRLKAVEAAAAGRPMISTALGAEGLPLRAGTEFLRAEDAAGFAAAAAQVRAGGLEPMVAAARRAVEPLLWPRIVDDLAERYHVLGAQTTSTR